MKKGNQTMNSNTILSNNISNTHTSVEAAKASRYKNKIKSYNIEKREN